MCFRVKIIVSENVTNVPQRRIIISNKRKETSFTSPYNIDNYIFFLQKTFNLSGEIVNSKNQHRIHNKHWNISHIQPQYFPFPDRCIGDGCPVCILATANTDSRCLEQTA